MAISVFGNEVVAGQSIGGDGAARLNVMQDKGFKGICRAIQGDVQTNATHSFLHVSPFHSDGNDGFPMGTAPSGP